MMVYIETIIKCQNCDYDYGQTYYNQIPDLSVDSINEVIHECNKCTKEICDHCGNQCDQCGLLFCNDHISGEYCLDHFY